MHTIHEDSEAAALCVDAAALPWRPTSRPRTKTPGRRWWPGQLHKAMVGDGPVWCVLLARLTACSATKHPRQACTVMRGHAHQSTRTNAPKRNSNLQLQDRQAAKAVGLTSGASAYQPTKQETPFARPAITPSLFAHQYHPQLLDALRTSLPLSITTVQHAAHAVTVAGHTLRLLHSRLHTVLDTKQHTHVKIHSKHCWQP